MKPVDFYYLKTGNRDPQLRRGKKYLLGQFLEFNIVIIIIGSKFSINNFVTLPVKLITEQLHPIRVHN